MRPNIEAIRERLQKATPGPWRLVDEDSAAAPYTVRAKNEWGTVGDYRGGIVARIECNSYAQRDNPEHRVEDNAALIANAPADLAALLERVDQLEAELVIAWGDCSNELEPCRACARCYDRVEREKNEELENLRATVKRLETELGILEL